MKYILISLILILSSLNLSAQNSHDAQRLKLQAYMFYANKLNCDSSNGSNLEHRICLNKEFQHVDSIMNNLFVSYIALQVDSLKTRLIAFQDTWVDNRRIQSDIRADEASGHLLGILYLDCMVETTKLRIKELQYLLSYD